MTGETDLTRLIKEMKPRQNDGEFVFCVCDSPDAAHRLNPLGLFHEHEGITVILPRSRADEAQLIYATVLAWITLDVHSSLEAVGLTAAVSTALAEAKISCNVVAAYYHDHIFVPVTDAKRAMEVLMKRTGANHE